MRRLEGEGWVCVGGKGDQIQTPCQTWTRRCPMPAEGHPDRNAEAHLSAGGLGVEVAMLYPVYLHLGDESHAYGITIPDFPGCFSAADSLDDLAHLIQEAAELYFEGEEMEIPQPTPLEQLKEDPDYQDGTWKLVEIDVSKLHTRSRLKPTAKTPRR